MGNGSGKEGGNARTEASEGWEGDPGLSPSPGSGRHAAAAGSAPPDNAQRFMMPFLFSPQAPVASMQRCGPELPLPFNPHQLNQQPAAVALAHNLPMEKGNPTLITWSQGGNDVFIEGSWDNWTSRKPLQKCGKDHAVVLVLLSGVYHYRYIVDGEWKHVPDLPCLPDDSGNYMNVLNVNDYVPDNLASVSEFESPPSPDSSYGSYPPREEDFAKEPPAVPPQLNLADLCPSDAAAAAAAPAPSGADEATERPRHVVLNHLFIEKGWGPRSVVALGMTQRYQSKYVTVVLYKPMKRR